MCTPRPALGAGCQTSLTAARVLCWWWWCRLAASGDDSGLVVVWDCEEEYRRVDSLQGP